MRPAGGSWPRLDYASSVKTAVKPPRSHDMIINRRRGAGPRTPPATRTAIPPSRPDCRSAVVQVSKILPQRILMMRKYFLLLCTCNNHYESYRGMQVLRTSSVCKSSVSKPAKNFSVETLGKFEINRSHDRVLTGRQGTS